MPLNSQNTLVCINHPKEELQNKTYVSMMKMQIIPGNMFPTGNHIAKLYYCNFCGYTEVYTVTNEDMDIDIEDGAHDLPVQNQ